MYHTSTYIHIHDSEPWISIPGTHSNIWLYNIDTSDDAVMLKNAVYELEWHTCNFSDELWSGMQSDEQIHWNGRSTVISAFMCDAELYKSRLGCYGTRHCSRTHFANIPVFFKTVYCCILDILKLMIILNLQFMWYEKRNMCLNICCLC